MPDRYLRAAILDSERFNTLTPDAQNFYYRLISIVDDFGCYDGRPPVIAAAAFHYGRTDALPILDLQRHEMIVRYLNAGKPYIAILQWGEVKRGVRRFPAPPINNDRPAIKYAGVYGRHPNWRNPQRTDITSILLGLDGKPVMPQPPEWRRITSDFAPLDALSVEPGAPEPGVPGSGAPEPTRHRSNAPQAPKSHRSVEPGTPGPGVPINSHQSSIKQQPSSTLSTPSFRQSTGPGAPEPVPPEPTATTATPTNGEIKLNPNGEWEGVSEAQRLRWQGMFADMSIPDQLERAGQWLLANPTERRQYEAEEDGVRAFLIRWLLRESKSAAKTQ